MARLLLGGNDFGNGDENLDSQKSNTVLVVLDKMLEEGYHIIDNDRSRHLPDKLGHVGRGLTANHGGFVVDQQAKLVAELFLDRRRDLLVRGCEEAAARHLGCEPVGLGETDSEGNKVFFDLLRGQAIADFVERLDSLFSRLDVGGLLESMLCEVADFRAYLVAHDRLFNGCEILQRRENNVSPLRTTDIFDEAAELFTQSNQDLVLILDRFYIAKGLAAENKEKGICESGAGAGGRADHRERESAPLGCAQGRERERWSRDGGWH